jgi:hypothetical protein
MSAVGKPVVVLGGRSMDVGAVPESDHFKVFKLEQVIS